MISLVKFQKIKKYIKKKFNIIIFFKIKKNFKNKTKNNLEIYKINKNYKKIKKIFFNDGKILFTNNKGNIFLLYDKEINMPIGTCWCYQIKKKWLVTEIDKIVNFKDSFLLYDFYILKKYRNKGYYLEFLNILKKKFIDKKIRIYCSLFNYYSLKGIIKSGFNIYMILSNFFTIHK